MCVNVVLDNAYVSDDFCEVARGQQNVTDGCYNPNTAVKSPALSTTLTTVVNGGSSGPSTTLTTVVEGGSSGITIVYTPAVTHVGHALSLGPFDSNHWRFLLVLPCLVCLLGSRY